MLEKKKQKLQMEELQREEHRQAEEFEMLSKMEREKSSNKGKPLNTHISNPMMVGMVMQPTVPDNSKDRVADWVSNHSQRLFTGGRPKPVTTEQTLKQKAQLIMDRKKKHGKRSTMYLLVYRAQRSQTWDHVRTVASHIYGNYNWYRRNSGIKQRLSKIRTQTSRLTVS